MRLNSPKNLLEFVRSARFVEDADPYGVSLAEFAPTGQMNSNPFFRRHARRKNSFGLARRQPLVSTKRGIAPCDKHEYSKREPGQMGRPYKEVF